MRVVILLAVGLASGLCIALASCVGDQGLRSSIGDAASESASATGGESQPCYPNGTCNIGLECLSNVCVNTDAGSAMPTDGGGGSDGGAGDADSGNIGDTGTDACTSGYVALPTSVCFDGGARSCPGTTPEFSRCTADDTACFSLGSKLSLQCASSETCAEFGAESKCCITGFNGVTLGAGCPALATPSGNLSSVCVIKANQMASNGCTAAADRAFCHTNSDCLSNVPCVPVSLFGVVYGICQ